MSANQTFSLCGCLLDVLPERLADFFNHPGVDLIEWRLDAFIRKHSRATAIDSLGMLASQPRHKVVVTNRPVREGGAFEGSEEERIDILRRAAEAGADWVDVEDDVRQDYLERIQSTNARVLLSHHDFSSTPDRRSLRQLVERMAQKGAGALKITTYAGADEDNLRVLELIPFGRREFGIEVIAFCMGPLGRWSRFVCLLLGSPWTYVQLPEQPAAAPGQFTAAQMRALLKAGGWSGAGMIPSTPSE
jgi:3-dehydroquinate dehydratase-1